MRPDAPPPPRRARHRSFRRVGICVAVLPIVALFVLWFDRKPIATGYIARTFAAAHVRARYTLAELGPGHQRLTDVVIGDPAHPDLIADWIETETGIGFGGARVTGLRAGHLRLRGTLVNGHLSLGTIDRLLPVTSGKAFALPAIDLRVADGRMRLETAMGTIGLKLAGQGRLDDGFRGTIAAVSDRGTLRGCAATRLAAALRIATNAGRPTFAGPVRLNEMGCRGARIAGMTADVDATLASDLGHWRGRVTLATQRLSSAGYAANGVRGAVSFDGDEKMAQGRVSMTLDMPGAKAAKAASAAVAGAYRLGTTSAFDGTMRIDHVALAPWMVSRIAATGASAAGTPVGPIADAISRAAAIAARNATGEAAVAVAWANGQGALRIESARVASASGARLLLSGGAGARIDWPKRVMTIDTDAALAGGGLPGIRASLRQVAPDAPVRGLATVDPYDAGGARMTLTPVRFAAGRGGITIETQATLSGPLADGRIEALAMPIEARWDSRSRIVLNDRCTPIAFDRLSLAGLRLGSTRLGLCPVDGALVRIAAGRIGGGATMGAVRLAGTLGGSPLALTADTSLLRLADRSFALTGVHALLGPADRLTRLDVGDLRGVVASAIGGRFAGGAGQIANVPLALSGAAGEWRFANGALSVTGALRVADADRDARFKPLAGRNVVLTLAGGRIDANGTLVEPTTGTKVADVAIHHDLSGGAGSADLTIPALAFSSTFQPDLLTPLTYGVIAQVKGDVTGAGHIAWTPAGVTSTGRFKTDDLDLAAAFGPVSGVAGEIVFTDLLSLQSAPGQVATVRNIDPGIAVTDGRIAYQTLPGARIQVEGAHWPFAGGALTLDPSLLDFSAPAQRRLTFHVSGAAAEKFLQQFDFKNLDASGVFDGVLPMIFDATGGRIEKGVMTVRSGGGSIAYVGDLTQKDLGFWGNLAFQTLKSLRYRSLSVTMNGPLDGEMVTAVRFAGVSQGAGAKSNFLIRRLQRLPFVFNVTIRAPFRGLLDSAADFYDPQSLIHRRLPMLLEQADPRAATPTPIQPPASRTMP